MIPIVYIGCPTRYHIQCVPHVTIYSVSRSLPYTVCPTHYDIERVPLATIYRVSHSLWNTACPTRYHIQGVPIATEPGISLIILKPMKILQRNLNRSTFIVWEMNRNVSLVRFKFLCYILIHGKIIKEMSDSVASGTHCKKFNFMFCHIYTS